MQTLYHLQYSCPRSLCVPPLVTATTLPESHACSHAHLVRRTNALFGEGDGTAAVAEACGGIPYGIEGVVAADADVFFGVA